MGKDNTKTPKPLPLPSGKTLQSYPLAPVDGFILSRVDGTMTVGELVTVTGLDAQTVDESLAKLAKLGLVQVPDVEPTEAAQIDGASFRRQGAIEGAHDHPTSAPSQKCPK